MAKKESKEISNKTLDRDCLCEIEEELKKSEEKYRTLFENSSDAIMLLDDNGFFDCNKSTLKMFASPKKENFTTMKLSDLSPEIQPDGTDSLTEINKKIASAYKNGSNHFEWVLRKLSGEAFFGDVLLTIFNLKEKQALQATIRDITETRRAQAEYRTILQTALDGFYAVNPYGHILDVNDSYCSMTGYDREELLNMSIEDVDAADTKEMIDQRIQQIIKVGYARFETKHRRKDGKIIDIEASVRYSKETTEKMFVFMHDITARKRLEQELLLNGKIINSMSEGVYLVRLNDGKIVYTNPKFEKMFGYEKDEMIGKNVEIVNATTKKTPAETAKEIIGALNKTGEWHGRIENKKKDGTHFWCYASCSIFDHIEFGKVIVAVHTDITERKNIE